MMKVMNAAARLLTVVVVFFAATACSSPKASSPGDRYQPEFDELIASVGTDEPAASILSDHQLSESEMLEAQQVLDQCMKNEGFSGAIFEEDLWVPAGSHVEVDQQGREAQDVLEQCDERIHYGELTYLYGRLHHNPMKLDPDQVVIDCMVRRGVLDPSYTVERFEKELSTWIEQPHTMRGEVIIGSPGEAFTYIGDREDGIQVYMECAYDPTSGQSSEPRPRKAHFRVLTDRELMNVNADGDTSAASSPLF